MATAATPQSEIDRRKMLERPAKKPQPFVIRLDGDRKLLVELPAKDVAFDPDGEMLLRPAAVHLLDRLRVGATEVPDHPSPGWVKILREVLDLTPEAFGEATGVDAATVSQWERGEARPDELAVSAMRRLRAERVRQGVLVA